MTFIQTSWSELSLRKGTKKSSEQKAEQVYALICKGASPLHEQALQEFLQLFKTI